MTPPPRRPDLRPLVIAHRGASTEYAEHTLPAYQRAIELGVDGVECDVRLTQDGHLVCIHDRRVDRTSTARGPVASMTLAELQRLDLARWHGDERPASVLTFRSLLELLHDADRPVRLLVETKHPTRFSGWLEQQLVVELARVGWADGADGMGTGESPVTVMSFASSALRRVHRLAPSLPTVLLMEWMSGERRVGRLPEHITIAGPSVSLLRNDGNYVERAHKLGNQIYVWTVEPHDLEYLVGLGVDAVITDDPAEIQAALRKLPGALTVDRAVNAPSNSMCGLDRDQSR
jgi:glycerophosphoryl diester phosphodiesterase